MSPRVALYSRLSTSEQADRGTSGATQVARLREHAGREGWHVEAEFADHGVSGDLPLLERPAAAQLLALCRAGRLDLVAVVHSDRFGRDMVESLVDERELKRAGVALVCTDEGIDLRREGDRLQWQIRAAIAEQEKRRLLDRTARGLVARARAGAWPGGPAPYGLRLAQGVATHRGTSLEVNPAEAAVIEQAVQLVLEGGSTWSVAQQLNLEGLRTRTGARWHPRNLRRTLLSPHLRGEWTYHSKTDGDVTTSLPAVVEPERHRALVSKLQLRSTGPRSSNSAHAYPLSAFLTSPCGASMHGGATRTGGRFYRCANARRFGVESCGCRNVSASALESEVRDVLALSLTKERVLVLVEQHVDQEAGGGSGVAVATAADGLAAAERSLARVEAARADALADALIDGADVAAVTAALNERRAVATASVEQARAAVAEHQARESRADRVDALVHATRDRLWQADGGALGELLRGLEVQVTVRAVEGCESCSGTGKTPGGTGGLRCPECRGFKVVPEWRLEGVLPLDLSSLGAAVSRRWTCCRR